MISWQQWSKRWGSWSDWRANCLTFPQDARNSRAGVIDKDHPHSTGSTDRRQPLWLSPGRKAMNYFSTTSRRRI